MRGLWMVALLAGCPVEPGPEPLDTETDTDAEADTDTDTEVAEPTASGLWTGGCEQIGALEMDLTDDSGAVTGSLVESSSSSASEDIVVEGTRTDATLTLSATYVDSDDLLGTLELTLDADTLDGEYLYPGDDTGFACTFGR